MPDSAFFFDLDTANLSVQSATLRVLDREKVADFYTQVLGLERHSSDGTSLWLGAEQPFLELRADPHAARARSSDPGLFHLAYLLPQREDLSSWLIHSQEQDAQLDGAADHGVSEALYLRDPEGNGVEVYADKPVAQWQDPEGRVAMHTHALRFETLPAPNAWNGIPNKTRIGHAHLQTGDQAASEAFWTHLGFDITAHYPGATFFGSGGYHHQLAANTWKSGGHSPRTEVTTGLDTLILAANPERYPTAKQVRTPEGVTLKLDPR